MKVEPREVILKDGRKCILRNGTALMGYVLEIADNIIGYELIDLEVVSENKRAIALYTKMGFKKIGERPMALKLDNGGYFSEDIMCRIKN